MGERQRRRRLTSAELNSIITVPESDTAAHRTVGYLLSSACEVVFDIVTHDEIKKHAAFEWWLEAAAINVQMAAAGLICARKRTRARGEHALITRLARIVVARWLHLQSIPSEALTGTGGDA